MAFIPQKPRELSHVSELRAGWPDWLFRRQAFSRTGSGASSSFKTAQTISKMCILQ